LAAASATEIVSGKGTGAAGEFTATADAVAGVVADAGAQPATIDEAAVTNNSIKLRDGFRK
jgi:hypothetical protein